MANTTLVNGVYHTTIFEGGGVDPAILEGKMDKVPDATPGNISIFDSGGNATDSNKKPSDFADATQFANLKTQVETIIGVDANFKGIFATSAELPVVTTAAWAMVGNDLTALDAYVITEGGSWAKFGSATYDFSGKQVTITPNTINGGYDIAVGGGTSTNVAGQDELRRDYLAKLYGKNLFSILNSTSGKYITSSGTLANGNNYNVTDYIEIEPATAYYLSINTGNYIGGSGYVAFYNAAKTLTGTCVKSKAFTTPADAKYLRLTYTPISVSQEPMLEIGSTRSTYAERTPIGGYTAEIKIDQINADNLAIAHRSINLFDKDSDLNTDGYYLNTNYNSMVQNATKFVTHYIRVVAGETIYVNTSFSYQYCFVGDNMAVVSGGTITSHTLVVPNEATLLRFAFDISSKEYLMFHIGTTAMPYVPFGKRIEQRYIEPIKGIPQMNGLLGSDGKSVSTESMAAGDTLEMTDYPESIKFGESIIFEATIDTFSSIIIGKGYRTYCAFYFEINDTNVILKDYDSSENTISTTAHGLTIGAFIKVIITRKTDGSIQFVLNTLDGVFSKNYENSLDYSHGKVGVRSVGTILTDVKLGVTCESIRKQVWIFGDSYLSFSAARYPYYLKEWGFSKNALFCGYPGAWSTDIYPDLLNCLKYGVPKYVIWCLGMNDSDGVWLSLKSNVENLCQVYGVELILATIPSVPARDNTTISAAVKASGYRYIDFAKAVHGETYTSGVNNWYGADTENDYLESNATVSNRVHPTILGAKALASQFLIDFPELMQY